jgi:hypothetical protein
MDGEKSDTSTETDTPKEGDTETADDIEALKARLAELEKENEIAKKRVSDKDKYINELKQGKQEEPQLEVELDGDDDFWDDPEAKYKAMVAQYEAIKQTMEQQLLIANRRIDENAYALTHPDYYEIVTSDAVKAAMEADPEFAAEISQSNAIYETAYLYMKSQKETKAKQAESAEAELERKILAKYGINPEKATKQVPPSMKSIGNANGNRSESNVDGFAEMFGGY